MRSTRRTFLKGLGAAAGMAAVGTAGTLRGMGAQAAGKTTVTMWTSPFVPGTSVDPPLYDAWLAKNAPTALPNVRIPSDYGPGPYATMQSKYLVQAKCGTPDIIEGLLENIVAYIKAGLITPLNARFNAWPDHTQFGAVKG